MWSRVGWDLCVLLTLLAALTVFEPLFEGRSIGRLVTSEGLPVGHGGSFEGPRFTQLLLSLSFGTVQFGPAQVGPFEIRFEQKRCAKACALEVSINKGRPLKVGSQTFDNWTFPYPGQRSVHQPVTVGHHRVI